MSSHDFRHEGGPAMLQDSPRRSLRPQAHDRLVRSDRTLRNGKGLAAPACADFG